MAKRKAKKNYRAIKKRLNKLHKFSFRLPRKGKDLTPAQKTQITKLSEKYRNELNRLKYNKGTVKTDHALKGIKKSSGWVKTNKGWFIPHAQGQEVRLTKRKGKTAGVRFKSKDQDRLFVKYSVTDGEFFKWVDREMTANKRYGYKMFLLSINGSQGKTLIEQKDAMRYGADIVPGTRRSLKTHIKKVNEKYDGQIFDGIWLIK